MRIAIVATHKERYYNTLIRSLEHNQLHYDVLGFGKKWTGFLMKYRLMIEWLNEQNPSEIVMHLDAFDSIVVGNVEKAVNEFKNSGKNVLFSRGPFICNPILRFLHKYINYRVMGTPIWLYDEHVNTGMYIGYAGVLKELLSEVLELCDSNDDERCMNKNRHLLQKYNVGIDKSERILLNITDFSDYDTNRKPPFAVSFPCGATVPHKMLHIFPFKVDPCENCRRTRFLRVIPEYAQFFWLELIIIFLLFAYQKRK
jgi:hypothetical protein